MTPASSSTFSGETRVKNPRPAISIGKVAPGSPRYQFLSCGLGIASSKSPTGRGAALRKVLDRLDIFNLDEEAAEAASRIFLSSQAKGRSIDQNDAIMAATCISRGCSAILTRNVRNFQGIRSLRVETY